MPAARAGMGFRMRPYSCRAHRLAASNFGSGHSRNGPVALVSACQNAANLCHSLGQAARPALGDVARTRPADVGRGYPRFRRDFAARSFAHTATEGSRRHPGPPPHSRLNGGMMGANFSG